MAVTGNFPGQEDAFAQQKGADRRILIWMLLGSALLLSLLLWQCGSGFYKTTKLSETAVSEFHQRLNAEKYEEIYTRSDPRFQRADTRENLIKFFRSVHHKMGNAAEARFQTINIQAKPSGKLATATYQTKFAEGSAVETFTWSVSKDGLLLMGYNIQSAQLVQE